MPVLYGGYSIRPAPQVSLSKQFHRTGDGRLIGTTISARLTGTVVAEKTADTVTPLPINSHLSAITAKMAALRAAFAQDGQIFEIDGYDAAPPVQFNAIIDSIDFAEGQWVETADYTITLHGDTVAGEDMASQHCEAASETWTFEEGDLPRTWKATHAVSAKGKLVYHPDGSLPLLPWQIAKAFATSQIGLDWTTTTTFSPSSGSALSDASAVAPPSDNQWDRHVTEVVDEDEGTYSATETWTLNALPYVEQYVISVHRVDDPNVTTVASVSGTITGLRKTMGINDDKYNAALAAWGTIESLLVVRCQAAASSLGGLTLNSHPLANGVDHDQYAGTITYQFEFNDREYVNDTYELYTVTSSVNIEEYKTNVRIDGTITGAEYLDSGPSKTIKYARAALQWEIVRPLLLARAIADSGVAGLKPFPVQAQVVENQREGSIQYVYEFDDRDPQDVKHEYTVTKKTSREDGTDRVSIEGNITGNRLAHDTSPFGTGDKIERFNLANAYYAGISGNLLGMAAQYVSLNCINPTPMTTSVGYSPLGGSVSYSAEFTSTIMPLTPGALTELITLNDESACEVIAVLPVLGRAQGPVIQDMGTIKEKRRTLTVEIVMTPPKFGCTPTVTRPAFDVTPYIPTGNPLFKEQDSEQWAERIGRYSRTVIWIYE